MTEPTVESSVSGERRGRRPATKAGPEGPSQHPLTRLQRLVGNRAVTQLVARTPGSMAQPTPTPVVQRQEMSVHHTPWTGDPVSMANTLRDLVGTNKVDQAVRSLSMLWIRSIVDTLRMLKLEPETFKKVTSAPGFAADARLTASLDVVEGRPVRTKDLFPDQATELQAMQDVPRWPSIIGPQAPPKDDLPSPDRPNLVRRDPEYLAALYDAIKRNRDMAGQYALEKVKKGYKYVGAPHKDDRPAGLGQGDEKRKAVNAAIWNELGVGEGTQASVNTYDSAKFSFGPGFAARGGLDVVMKNLAKSGAGVLVPLQNAGVVFQDGTWYVVDPDARSVKAGKEALDILSKNVGLIGSFLDTAQDPEMRRQWMDAEWQALSTGGGAADVPAEVVNTWPIETIVFVAHCVHWRPILGWKNHWSKLNPPSIFQAVRDIAPHIPREKDGRILTKASAETILGFSRGLLRRTLKEHGKRMGIATPLPDDWDTGFAGAIALPTNDKPTTFHILLAEDKDR